jgi:hypothetical protein
MGERLRKIPKFSNVLVKLFSAIGYIFTGTTKYPNSRKSNNENFVKSSVNNSGQQRIFAAVDSLFRGIRSKRMAIHIPKSSELNNQKHRVFLSQLLSPVSE